MWWCTEFKYFPTDIIGQCPPQELPEPVPWGLRLNPYWAVYGQTSASLDLPAISEATVGNDNFFDDNDSFTSSLLSDPDNAANVALNPNVALDPNYNLALVSNDVGEGQDISLFDATA